MPIGVALLKPPITMPTDNYGFEHRQAVIRDRVACICLKFMQKKKMTKTDFANLIQLSTSQLKEITNKRSNTTLNVLIKISTITGESILI